ncbi:uncharacterized protein V6R79_004071 [Siganus canaliculatus]
MLRRLRRLFCCTASEEDDAPAENRWKEEEEERVKYRAGKREEEEEEEEERRPHRAREVEEDEERRKYRSGDVAEEEEEDESWRQKADDKPETTLSSESEGREESTSEEEEEVEEEEEAEECFFSSSGSDESLLGSSLKRPKGHALSLTAYSAPSGSDSDLGGFSQTIELKCSSAPHGFKWRSDFRTGSSFFSRVANTAETAEEDERWSQEAYMFGNLPDFGTCPGSDSDRYLGSSLKDFVMSGFGFPKLKLGSIMKKRKSSSFNRSSSSIRTALTSVLRHPPPLPPPPAPAPPPAEVTVSDDIYEASSSSYFFCPPPVHPGSVPDLQSPSAQVDFLHPVPAAAAGAEHAAESSTPMEVEAAVYAVSCTVTNAPPSLIAPPRSPEEFFPELLSAGSHEEEEEEEGSFRFQCSRPGLYQCSVTGLLFHMDGEGDVLYRTVPWNRRLLAQHHKQPAGPLFDIQCVQQCVRQLHLPHCEIHSTAAAPFLSVAHVTDEGVDFLRPQQVTETHLVLNISGFSAYGNVKEADSPPGPVRALVLLFYRPPAQEEPESVLKVLLLPGNVVVFDVVRQRKKLCPDERYLETPSRCRLQPQQEYTLSTRPEEDWILVQPPEAEFDSEGYDNYIPSFEVILERILKHLKLIVRDVHSSNSVWERRVYLRSAGVNKSCDQGPSGQRLLDVRSSFIDGVSAPVLQSLLDKLLEKQVLSDSEKDEVSKPQSDRDRARYVIDVVRKKGDAASSEMIDFLCELDPFLCQRLGLS